MNLRDDKLQSIPIDQFVSASGRWISIFTECFSPQAGNLRAFFIVIVAAGTNQIRMVKRLCFDDRLEAEGKWLGWKEIFGSKSPDATYEEDVPPGLHEFKISPPYLIEEDESVLRMKPRGARIFIREITPVDEYTARAAAANLHVVIDDAHKPRPTTGIVLAVGEDPLAQELYRLGDIVMYSPHSGTSFRSDNEDYRSLELHEIIGVQERQEDLEDIKSNSPQQQPPVRPPESKSAV